MPKKPAKDQREKLILFALVELYLKTGKPIGSNTLKTNGFDELKLRDHPQLFLQTRRGGISQTAALLRRTGSLPPLAYKLYAESI